MPGLNKIDGLRKEMITAEENARYHLNRAEEERARAELYTREAARLNNDIALAIIEQSERRPGHGPAQPTPGRGRGRGRGRIIEQPEQSPGHEPTQPTPGRGRSRGRGRARNNTTSQ